MEVLQKAATTVQGIASNAIEVIQAPRNMQIYVSNGTDVPITLVESSGASGGASFESGLEPGCAGALCLANRGEIKGEVKLSLGGKDILGIWVRFSRLGSADVMLQFAKHDQKLRRRRWVSSPDGHFTLSSSTLAAHVRTDAEDTQCMVHVLVGPRDGLTRHSRRPSLRGTQKTEAKFSGLFLFEGFTSMQFLTFAEWCHTQNPSGLVGALFLMEYSAVIAGLQGVTLADRAFMLNLLISAFIVNGALYLHSLVYEGSLERYLNLWRDKEPKALSQERLLRYSSYGALRDKDLHGYVDSAILLLKTASIQCWFALAKSAQQLMEKSALGEQSPPNRPSRTSTASSHDTSRNDDMLFQKLGTTGMKEELNRSTRKSRKECDSENRLMAMVRKCVHTSASFNIRSSVLFEEVEAALPDGSAQKALRHYREWVPAAIRRFELGDVDGKEAEEVIGGGGQKKCLPFCGKRASSASVSCTAMGTEVFVGLDGGLLTNSSRVLHSLGCDSMTYRTMSTNSKSGEFFFFSGDRQYLIKTISEEEGKLFFGMLPGYQAHIRRMPQSLIVRYAGLFCLDLDGIGKKYFSVMANVFDPLLAIHDTFDVKGSMFNRKKKGGEKIGKDEDWVAMQQRLRITQEACAELCAAHEQDAAFLQSHSVMDYSLLIGIHQASASDLVRPGEGGRRGDSPTGGIWSADSKTLYFAGIIDFLIRFGISKQGEHFIRFAQGHREDASCVDPHSYARRQVRFVRDQVVEVPEKGHESLMGNIGMLRVKVSTAHNLRVADVTGTSDPYINVSLGLQRHRTPTIMRNCDPTWNAVLCFAVDEAHVDSQVEFSVMDEDVGTLQGSDDFLGRLVVPVANVMDVGVLQLHQEPLKEVKQGRLSVTLEFFESPETCFSL